MDFFRDLMVSLNKDYMSNLRADYLKESSLTTFLKTTLSLSLQPKNPN
jgi:hypothetical protein